MKNTYLGFTDNMKPMQKAKVEKTLDNLTRVNGKVLTDKEFVYIRLTEQQATPVMQENYSVYSRKTDAMTKPKTVYSLEWKETNEKMERGYDSLSNDISKTLYDYALHIINNGFLDAQKVASFIQEEQQREIDHIAAQALQQAQEQAERDQKKQAYENHKLWLTDQAMNYTDNSKLNLALEIFNSEIGEIDQFTMKKYLIEIENIDNPFCRSSLLDKLHSNNTVSKKIFFHITGIKLPNTDKDTMPLLESLTVNDFTGMIPYKKRKEYTSTDPETELQTFYKMIQQPSPHFEEAQGEHINKYGIDMYITETKEGYAATEGKSGMILVRGKTKVELMDNLKRIKDEKGLEYINKAIEDCIKRFGMSPKYIPVTV